MARSERMTIRIRPELKEAFINLFIGETKTKANGFENLMLEYINMMITEHLEILGEDNKALSIYEASGAKLDRHETALEASINYSQAMVDKYKVILNKAFPEKEQPK